MEKMIEKTEQSAYAREYSHDELIAYILGLLARYDDRHEYVD